MIIAFAGHRPSGSNDDSSPGGTDWVNECLERVFAGLQPRLTVGVAPPAADLFPAEAALRVASAVRLITVADAGRAGTTPAGRRWSRRLAELARRDGVEVLPAGGASADAADDVDDVDDADAEPLATQALVLAAESLDPEEELVVLVVGRAGVSGPAELLADGAKRRGHLVLRLDPALTKQDMPEAFVAMPYGTKPDPTRQLQIYQSDETWKRVLIPAMFGSGYRPIRVDVEAGQGVIDLTMLRGIGTADLFIADLATHNPNVFWELGVRHAWRADHNMLIGPKWVQTPFDANHMMVHHYEREPSRISDRDAVTAIRMLQTIVAGAVNEENTSPIFAAIPDLPPVALPQSADPAAQAAITECLDQISIAVEFCSADRLEKLVGHVRRQDIPASSRRMLIRRIGLALVDVAAYGAAADLLKPLADADTKLDDLLLQQRYALTMIHRDDPDDARRLAYLTDAEKRLLALDRRHPNSSETLGLLGSAAKTAVKRVLKSEQPRGEELRLHATRAIDAYRRGLKANLSDYFPGINLVAMLRLCRQHFKDMTQDPDEIGEITTVVRYAVTHGPHGPPTVWHRATLGELALHDYLLSEERDPALLDKAAGYYSSAGRDANGQERESMRRQLQFFIDAGDPSDVIGRLLACVPEDHA